MSTHPQVETRGLLQDFNRENTISKSVPSFKLADSKSICRRCDFVREAIVRFETISDAEWDLLLTILCNTKDGSLLINELTEKRSDCNKSEAEPPNDEIPELPQLLTCEWINKFTHERCCTHCDLRGIVKGPVDLGLRPWNTDKRTMMLDGHLDEEILKAEAVLANYPDIYYQGDRLVRVIGNRLKAVSGSTHAPLEVQSLSSANLKEMLSAHFVFLKVEGDKVHAVYPTPSLVKGILERAKYPSLNHLRGVTEVPVLRPDGSVLQEPGYDPATELLYQPHREFPRVSDSPTPEDIQGALDQLLEVVDDFPFTNDLGRAVFLSTILTVVGRFAFQGCAPMVLINANTPGVGKSKLADAIGLITTGQPLPRSTQTGSAEEERKQITSILLKGGRLLLIDNLGSRFGSPALDALLTSEIWQDRILGRSKEATLPNLLQVIATGNNIQLKADTVRRCICMQLTSLDEHPEARSEFHHPDLEAWITSEQPRLLAAALTLLRGYVVAGKPEQNLVTLGSFAGWSSLVQATVKWAWGVDPGEARVVSEDEMDLDKEILERLMRGWQKLVPAGMSISCRRLMDAVLKSGEDGRDILEALEMSSVSGKRTAVGLGYLLTRYRKRIYMGSFFDHGIVKKTSEGRMWRLISLK